MPKLLIPGTGGVGFLENGSPSGYPVMMLGRAQISQLPTGRPADELRELLSMEHKPGQIAPVKRSLRPNTVLTPGAVLGSPYTQVPSDFDRFRYDWRADIRFSATSLLNKIETEFKGEKLAICTHSQGGLVAIVASQLCQQAHPHVTNAFSTFVSHVAFVGTPFMGTINAAQALVQGEIFGKQAASDIVMAIRTWPSIWQMLPDWTPALIDRETGKPSSSQFLDDATWERFRGCDPDMLVRARDVHQMLRYPLAGLGGIKVLSVFGSAYHTENSATLIDTDILFDRPTEPGDDLVPFHLTERHLPLLMQGAAITEIAGTHPEHAFLYTSGAVIDAVQTFFGT